MKERNTFLDAMKGFAMFLVMIGHILQWNKITDPYLYPIIEADAILQVLTNHN